MHKGLFLGVNGLTVVGWHVMVFLSVCPPAWGKQHFYTQRTAICYESADDLQEFDQKLRFMPPAHFLEIYFRQVEPAPTSSLGNLAAKIDGLLAAVCRLLRLRPQTFPRLHIILLKDGYQVQLRHRLFQPSPARPFLGYGHLLAFYESGHHTIFLSLADFHEGVLAHEMTHHLLCTAYQPPPPAQIQEAWASYVEAHLK